MWRTTASRKSAVTHCRLRPSPHGSAGMREIRAETPDGYIWFVRRRWLRRQTLWRPAMDRMAAGYGSWRRARADWERLRPGREIEQPTGVLTTVVGFAGMGEVALLLMALGVSLAALAVLAIGRLLWFEVEPWLAAQLTVVASMLAFVIIFTAFTLDRRPWLVVAERQGLDGAPHRVWRVIGWRRSARWARQVAQAIERGQLDLVPERDG
jgi:hypothetical protein